MAQRRLLATLVGVAVAVTTVASSAHGSAAGEPGPTGPAGPLAADMAEALEQQPGGVQVSDNAMVWDGGAVVVVWPDPGEQAAPAGLGSGIRADVVAELDLTALAALSPDGSRAGSVQPRGSVTSCPAGYYCFYTSTNFDGARYQFSSVCSAYASTYGFDNTTSSWVNRNYTRTVRAYDTAGGALLWSMPSGGNSSYVGAANDNRMSYWNCIYT